MATIGSPLVTTSPTSAISHWSRANDGGIEAEEVTVVASHVPSSLQEPGTAHIDLYRVFGSPKTRVIALIASSTTSHLLKFLDKC
jgi:hypothetical protein